MIRDGLRALVARDQAVERWLRKEAATAYDALKTSPSRVVAVSKVRARLAERHKKSTTKA